MPWKQTMVKWINRFVNFKLECERTQMLVSLALESNLQFATTQLFITKIHDDVE